MSGLHLPHDDPGITQCRPAEHRVQRAQEPGVAAPVPGERGVAVRLPGGVEVADDVRAPEGVDRLLRVADQHQRQVPGEVPQDAPLQGIRVLELVDEHDAVPGPQPRRRPAGGIGQRAVQTGDEIVVGVQTSRPLAALHLAAHRGRERVADRRGAGCSGGLQPRLRVADGPAGQPQCLGAVERGGAGGLRGELADVEVVGDLDHQVVHGLDEDRVPGIACDPECGQHLAAELVRGRDRRRVELGERGGQPPPADGDLGVRDSGEQRQHRVRARPRRRRVTQPALGAHQPLADAFAQLLRGFPTEGDEQQLGEAGVALGDVAGGERGDREGLAGARARLEHGGAGGQVAAHVEGDRVGRCRVVQHGGHPSTSASSRGRHSRSARSPNRVGSPPVPAVVSTSRPAAGPNTRE